LATPEKYVKCTRIQKTPDKRDAKSIKVIREFFLYVASPETCFSVKT